MYRITANGDALAGVKRVVFEETVNVDTDLRAGGVNAAYIKVEAFGTQVNAPEAGDELTLYDTQGNVTTKIGVFYAEPCITAKNSYSFVAYDNIKRLDADFSPWLKEHQADFPMTVYALVSAACDVAGVTLGSTSWPLSTRTVNAFSTAVSCREILSFAAEIGCRFVRCDADGQIVFAWYQTAENVTIAPSARTENGVTSYAYRNDGLEYENYSTSVLDRVAVHKLGTTNDAYVYPDVASGNTLHVRDNLLLTGADETLYTDVAENIYSGIVGISEYRPCRIDLFQNENPFRAGEIVTITDSQGVTFSTVIMTLTVDNGATLISTGGVEYSESTDANNALNNLSQAIQQMGDEVGSAIAGVREETSVKIQRMQEQILSTVQTTYYSQQDGEALEKSVGSQISQTADDITASFKTLLDDETSALNGQFTTLYSYIRMAGGTITLGQENNETTLKIENDRIGIYVNGEAITYWTADAFVSPSRLEIPEGGRLVLGHYAYIPRENGSLDFVWVGD